MDRKETIMMKKIFAGAMAAGILWCSCTASVSALPQKQSSMRDITTAQLVKDMGMASIWETPTNLAATGSPSGGTAHRNPMKPRGAVL